MKKTHWLRTTVITLAACVIAGVILALILFNANPSPDMVEYPVRVNEGSPQEYLLSFDDATITSDNRNSVFADWIQRRGYEHCYAWNKIYRASLWASRRFPVGQVFDDTAVMPDIIRQCKTVRYSSRGS